MKLTELLSMHRAKFRQKIVEAIAKKYSLTHEQVEAQYKDFIEQYMDDKYTHAIKLIERINRAKNPVLLNIRRDRSREDKCRICEANQPNVDQIAEKYGDRIEIIEASEDNPDGAALYHIIYQEEAKEKKLPLTALINQGEVMKFWAGKTVDTKVYERFIKKLLT